MAAMLTGTSGRRAFAMLQPREADEQSARRRDDGAAVPRPAVGGGSGASAGPASGVRFTPQRLLDDDATKPPAKLMMEETSGRIGFDVPELSELERPMKMIQETSGRIGFDVNVRPVLATGDIIDLGAGDAPAGAKLNTRSWWHCVLS
jgi:hypothetical protein